jgi:curved DNA-binding protein CbpA
LYFLELERVLERIEHSSTHYHVLGVEKTASTDEIGQAQRRTMAVLNPSDLKHTSVPDSFLQRIKEATASVVAAYMVLNNFGSRVEYDNSLNRRAPVPLPPMDLSKMATGPLDSASRAASKPPEVSKYSGTGSLTDKAAGAPSTTKFDRSASSTEHSQTGGQQDGSDQDTIDILHAPAQVLFTKPIDKDDKKSGNQRRYQRLKLTIPTYVTGHDRTKGKWTEVGHTVDVSIGGVSIELAKELRQGMVVHLTLPMPTKLRRHGFSDPAYQVYAIVRRVDRPEYDKRIIGLEFLGPSPPPGYLKKPWAKFHTKW